MGLVHDFMLASPAINYYFFIFYLEHDIDRIYSYADLGFDVLFIYLYYFLEFY